MKDPTLPTTHEPDSNLLAAYADGRLAPADADALERHLANCRRCRDVVAPMARGLAGAPGRRRAAVVPAAARWLALAATLVLATIVGTRLARERPVAAPVPQAEPNPAPRAAPTPEAPTAAPIASSAPPAAAPRDVRRGGGERRIGEKTFHLVAGEWVDAAYDATADLPVVAPADAGTRARLLAEHPELEPYTALGQRFLVVLGGTVYRLGTPAP